jgi:hypothetical protein
MAEAGARIAALQGEREAAVKAAAEASQAVRDALHVRFVGCSRRQT